MLAPPRSFAMVWADGVSRDVAPHVGVEPEVLEPHDECAKREPLATHPEADDAAGPDEIGG